MSAETLLGFFRTSSTELHDIPRAASPIRSSFTSIRPSLLRSSCSKSSAQSRSRSGSTPLSWHRALVQPERHPRCHMTVSAHGHPRRHIGSVKDGRRVVLASKKGAVSELKPLAKLALCRWCQTAVYRARTRKLSQS